MSPKIPFHRTATIVAGALIGLAGAVAAAAPASAHTAELTATAECTDVGWKAVWSLTTSDTDHHEGVLGDVAVDVDQTQVPPGTGGPPRLARITDGARITGDTTVRDTLRLYQDATSATLSLTVTWTVGEDTYTRTLQAQAKAPAKCVWPPEPEPSSFSASFGCTTMTVTLVNPASARETVALRLTPSEGRQRVLSARPGETRSAAFAATVGFTVDVMPASGPQPPGGAKPYTIAYAQPANCSTQDGGAAAGGGSAAGGGAAGSGSAAADNGDGGGLPVTGGAAGAVAGIAAALLTVGAVLFAVAHRRRVKFIA